MSVGLMAKKGKAKPGPKPAPQRVRSAVTNIRSSPEWKAWLERLADYNRSSSLADMIDDAVVAYARKIGFPETPPKR